MVARRVRGDGADVIRQQGDGVGRPAHLEGTRTLQVLALEDQLDTEQRVKRPACKHWRAMHGSIRCHSGL